MNKSDAADAKRLAQLTRTGWFTSVHIHSLDADRLKTLISARERLGHLRNDLEGHIRGILKTLGIRMTAIGQGKFRQAFRDQLAEAAGHEPIFGAIAEGYITVHSTRCTATAIDEDLRAIAKESDLARRLMTSPGVKPIVASTLSPSWILPPDFNRHPVWEPSSDSPQDGINLAQSTIQGVFQNAGMPSYARFCGKLLPL